MRAEDACTKNALCLIAKRIFFNAKTSDQVGTAEHSCHCYLDYFASDISNLLFQQDF